MTAVKTIVATAVIVFALTAVAMAGVQHYTEAPSAQAASKAPVQYTVTLTAQQLAQLMGQGKAATTRTVHKARHAKRHQEAARHQNTSSGSHRSYSAGSSGGRSYSGGSTHSSNRCYNNGGGWGSGSGSNSGGSWGGGGCW